MSYNGVMKTPSDFNYNDYSKIKLEDIVKIFHKTQYKELSDELWIKILSMIKEIWVYKMEKDNSRGSFIYDISNLYPMDYCEKNSNNLGYFHNNKWKKQGNRPSLLMRQILKLYEGDYLMVTSKKKAYRSFPNYTTEKFLAVIEEYPIMVFDNWDFSDEIKFKSFNDLNSSNI